MQAPCESFVEALTDEEICPLCLDGYAPVDECLCAVCEAPACPGCVEVLETSAAKAAKRCFACRPALVPPPFVGPAAPQPIAGRDAVPPPLLSVRAGKLPLPGSLARPRWSDGEDADLDEGGLVVFPAWRKRPLLALARAADAVHLLEISSVLVGWAHTGGRRFALAARVSREWSLALRARGAGLRRYGLALSTPLLLGLRLRGAALSQALKLRTLVLMSRTFELSRRVPRAARAAWSHVPEAARLPKRVQRAARAAWSRVPEAARLPKRVQQAAHYRHSISRACGACLRSAKKPLDALSARLLTK